MNLQTGYPDHIEDYLVTVRTGGWFDWTDPNNKIYENLNVIDGGTKPTEQECIDGLAQLQSDFDAAQTNKETKKTSGKQKLKDLGLDDDEIKALMGA